jgi:hypothetical protein
MITNDNRAHRQEVWPDSATDTELAVGVVLADYVEVYHIDN